jgi:hypothetical protein
MTWDLSVTAHGIVPMVTLRTGLRLEEKLPVERDVRFSVEYCAAQLTSSN